MHTHCEQILAFKCTQCVCVCVCLHLSRNLHTCVCILVKPIFIEQQLGRITALDWSNLDPKGFVNRASITQAPEVAGQQGGTRSWEPAAEFLHFAGASAQSEPLPTSGSACPQVQLFLAPSCCPVKPSPISIPVRDKRWHRVCQCWAWRGRTGVESWVWGLIFL